jgi:hypothetical protein
LEVTMIGKTTESGERDNGTLSLDTVTLVPPSFDTSELSPEQPGYVVDVRSSTGVARDAVLLPSEDPIALLGTPAHPLSTPPTSFDVGPPPLPPEEGVLRAPPKQSERTLAHGIMLVGAALILAPVFWGFARGSRFERAERVQTAPTEESPPVGLVPAFTAANPGRAAGAPEDSKGARAETLQSAMPSTSEAAVQIPPLVIQTKDPLADPSDPTSQVAPRQVAKPDAKAPRSEASTRGVGSSAAFDFSTAMNSVAMVAIGPGQCGPEATGVVPVSITFAPSGKATHAVVEGGALRGTTTGSCVATALKNLKVAPFEGDLATLRTNVVLK